MAFALTKANIKAIPYGKEIGFSRGIMGRKLKDGQSVRMFLQKKLYGKPIKVKIGTWPDIAIDEIEAKAREYRSLIEQGIHPYAAEEEKRKQRDEDNAERARRGATLRDILARLDKHKAALGGQGNSKATINDLRISSRANRRSEATSRSWPCIPMNAWTCWILLNGSLIPARVTS